MVTSVCIEDLPAKIANRIEPVGRCWLWLGPPLPKGHGSVRYEGRSHPVHRLVWELLVGPIEEGLVIDHLLPEGCVGNACCWPGHLEPKTHRENILRGTGIAAQNARKTACPKGHKYTPENTYRRPGSWRRECRACKRRG